MMLAMTFGVYRAHALGDATESANTEVSKIGTEGSAKANEQGRDDSAQDDGAPGLPNRSDDASGESNGPDGLENSDPDEYPNENPDPDPLDISEAVVEISGSYVYSGTPIAPAEDEVRVTLSGAALDPAADYDFEATNNVNAGTAQVTITGKGAYTGTAQGSFVIDAKSVTVTAQNATKAMGDWDPAFEASVDGVIGEDVIVYDLSREAGELPGTYAITPAGEASQGNYAVAYVPATLTIEPSEAYADISNMGMYYISLDGEGSYDYTGSAIKPKVNVRWDARLGPITLTEGKDYTVAYENNVLPGLATVLVTGKGAFRGTAQQTFSIVCRDASFITVTAPDVNYGELHWPVDTTPVVKLRTASGQKTLKNGTDYWYSCDNNFYPGEATVEIAFSEYYGNMKLTKKYRITCGMSKVVVVAEKYADGSLNSSGQEARYYEAQYSGKAWKAKPVNAYLAYPDGEGYDPSQRLAEGKDFTVSYKNNVLPGKATVTVTGKGCYTGTKSFTFPIYCKDAKYISVSGVPKQILQAGTYTKPKPTSVKIGSTVLKEGTHYTIKYFYNYFTNGGNGGNATLAIVGKGYYQFQKNISFKIIPSVAYAKTDIAYKPVYDNVEGWHAQSVGSKYVYSGKEKKPIPFVQHDAQWHYSETYTNGGRNQRILKYGTDYTVTWSNNVKVGTATATIKGKGKYGGTKKLTFTIVPKGSGVSKLTPAKKAITVTWAKQATQTTGYQVQWCLRKDFKSGAKTATISNTKTTSKKIGSLTSKKKYYVRVRTYKKVGDKTYYSSWSAVKAATAK